MAPDQSMLPNRGNKTSAGQLEESDRATHSPGLKLNYPAIFWIPRKSGYFHFPASMGLPEENAEWKSLFEVNICEVAFSLVNSG
jgi:hypothetical protein